MKPITLDFPDHFETERLLIRAPRIGDGPILNRAVCDSLQELRPWMPWAQHAPTFKDSETVVRQAYAQWIVRTDLMMLVFERESGELVGSSGLHRPDWNVPKFEIGYWRRTGFGKRGLMTEAVRAIADFASVTLDARRIEIRCSTLNQRSAALARRADFTLEATLHNERRHNKELHDTLVFARTKGGKPWNFTYKVPQKSI